MWLLRVSMAGKYSWNHAKSSRSRRPVTAGENVIDAEEEAALGEIHQQRDQIVAALLELQRAGARVKSYTPMWTSVPLGIRQVSSSLRKKPGCWRNCSAPSMES